MSGDSGTRQRILDAAVTILAQQKADRLSLRQVSACAGVSVGALYHHFRTREGLLEEVGLHLAQTFKDALFAGVQARPDPRVRLEVIVESLAGVGNRHPETLQLLALEPSFGVELLRRVYPDFVAILGELLVPVVEGGETLRRPDATSMELAELIVAMIMSAYLLPTTTAAAAGGRRLPTTDFLSDFSTELLVMVGSGESSITAVN